MDPLLITISTWWWFTIWNQQQKSAAEVRKPGGPGPDFGTFAGHDGRTTTSSVGTQAVQMWFITHIRADILSIYIYVIYIYIYISYYIDMYMNNWVILWLSHIHLELFHSWLIFSCRYQPLMPGMSTTWFLLMVTLISMCIWHLWAPKTGKNTLSFATFSLRFWSNHEFYQFWWLPSGNLT